MCNAILKNAMQRPAPAPQQSHTLRTPCVQEQRNVASEVGCTHCGPVTRKDAFQVFQKFSRQAPGDRKSMSKHHTRRNQPPPPFQFKSAFIAPAILLLLAVPLQRQTLVTALIVAAGEQRCH
eukprot:221805-Rhodomonas_salina.1